MMAGKTSNDEPKSQDKAVAVTHAPLSTFERKLVGIVVALVPTVFIALGAFIWTINEDVIKLEGRVTRAISATTDRYTKEDAHEDHVRVDALLKDMRHKIYELSAEVNRLKGLHEIHKKEG